MATIKARFDGRVFIPEGPVPLAPGSELEIAIPDHLKDLAKSTLDDLSKLVAGFPENPDWPVDGAAQHDHYLYGTPKKP